MTLKQNLIQGELINNSSLISFVFKSLFRKKLTFIELEMSKDKEEIQRILDKFSYNFESESSDVVLKVSRALTSEASFKRIAKVPLFISDIKNTIFHEIDGSYYKENTDNDIDVENNLVLNPNYLINDENENSLFSTIKSSVLNVLDRTIEKFNQVFESIDFDLNNTHTEEILEDFNKKSKASYNNDIILSIFLILSGIKFYDYLAYTDSINFPEVGVYASLSENFIYFYFYRIVLLFFLFWLYKKYQLFKQYISISNEYSEQISLFNEGKILANEISRLTSLSNQLEDWSHLLGKFMRNPFGYTNQLMKDQEFLELDDEKHLAFRIAEGNINFNEVSKIMKSVISTGWLSDLFKELLDDIDNYFLENEEINDLKKDIFSESISDVSNDINGPRKKLRKYIESSYVDIKSKQILKNKIENYLGRVKIKEIFSDTVSYFYLGKKRKDQIETFLGEIKTKGDSSSTFLPGVWSKSSKVQKPKSVEDFVIWAQGETEDDYGDIKRYEIEEDLTIDGPLKRAEFWLSISPEVEPSQIFVLEKPTDEKFQNSGEIGDA